MLYRLLSLVFLLFACQATSAQLQVVTGIITDASTDEPLIGAVVRMGDKGSVTDIDGKFSLEISGGSCLLKISYVGYRSKEVKCSGTTHMRIKLESDFVNLKDVEVTAKKFDVDSFLKRTQKNAGGVYISNRKVLTASYNVSLSDRFDTLLAAHMPVYFWGGKRQPFSYTVYQDRERSLKVHGTEVSRKNIDLYVYNVMGILSGSFAKFLDKFLQTDELDMISSTFYIGDKKYYDIVYISRDSRLISNELLHGATFKADTVGLKRYIWLHEFYIEAQSTAVTFYQQIMIESSGDGYKEFSTLKERNKIDDWLNKAKDGNAKYTNYKVIFQKNDDGKWVLKKELYTDRFWHPFYRGGDKRNYIYHFEYNIDQVARDAPQQYEIFNPDIALRKYLAD